MKRAVMIGALGLLALGAAGAGRGPQPCGCAMDPRVTGALIDAAGTLGGSDRAAVYAALAGNCGLDAESRLRLIDAARTLGGDGRRAVLVAMAGAGCCR